MIREQFDIIILPPFQTFFPDPNFCLMLEKRIYFNQICKANQFMHQLQKFLHRQVAQDSERYFIKADHYQHNILQLFSEVFPSLQRISPGVRGWNGRRHQLHQVQDLSCRQNSDCCPQTMCWHFCPIVGSSGQSFLYERSVPCKIQVGPRHSTHQEGGIGCSGSIQLPSDYQPGHYFQDAREAGSGSYPTSCTHVEAVQFISVGIQTKALHRGCSAQSRQWSEL